MLYKTTKELISELNESEHLPQKQIDTIIKNCVDCKHAYVCEWLPEDECEYREEQSKSGSWIEVETTEYGFHSVTDMKCNLCGRHATNSSSRQVYPYCPWCGAQMTV